MALHPLRCCAAIVGVICASLLLAGCEREAPPPLPPRIVNVLKVESVKADALAGYTGDVRARYETALGFRVPGKIVARLVDVGAIVKAGQPLARLDPADQQLGIDAARQQTVAAQANFEQLRNDLQRFTELKKDGFISAAELDRHTAAFEVAKAQLSQSKSQLDVSRNQSAYTVLTADHDGVVTAIAAETGQVVAAGQMVAKVARLTEKDVLVNIPENRVDAFRSTPEIAIDLWASPGKFYAGKVREISPAADPVTRTFAARVTIVDADAAVGLGMTANVYLRGNDAGTVARLPATAVFQKGDAPAVWVVDPKSSQVVLRPIKVARFGDEGVTVTDGLAAGEMVVRAGVHKLFAGEKVRVIAESAP